MMATESAVSCHYFHSDVHIIVNNVNIAVSCYHCHTSVHSNVTALYVIVIVVAACQFTLLAH